MPQFEAGTYGGRMTRIYGGELNNEKQTPYIAIEFEVTCMASEGVWLRLPESRQRTVKWFTTEKAAPYTMDKLLRMDFNGKLDSPEFGGWNPDEAVLTCKINENGYEDWDIVLPTGGGGSQGETWETDAKKKFEAQFKTYAETRGIKVQPKAQPNKAAAKAAMQGDVADEEVPF